MSNIWATASAARAVDRFDCVCGFGTKMLVRGVVARQSQAERGVRARSRSRLRSKCRRFSLPLLRAPRGEKKSVVLPSSHAREIAAVYFHINFGGGEENYFQCQLSTPPPLRDLFLVLKCVGSCPSKRATKRRSDVGVEEEEARAGTAPNIEAVLLRRHLPREERAESEKRREDLRPEDAGSI